MDFPHLTYEGPPIDDPETLSRIPPELASELRTHNGFIAWQGGFHLRGACHAPEWHSLRAAWDGPTALHRLFPAVVPMDVPFAEEACGDQFLLRDDRVLRLAAETGDVAEASPDLGTFLAAVRDEGIQHLGLAPLLAFQSEGHRLLPGQLLSAYPPFCTREAAHGVSLRAVPAHQRLGFLAELARQLRDVPDGGHVKFKIIP